MNMTEAEYMAIVQEKFFLKDNYIDRVVEDIQRCIGINVINSKE